MAHIIAMQKVSRLASLRAAVSLILLSLVIVLVLRYYGITNALDGVKKLPPLTIAIVMAALLANAIAAVLRFKVTASYTGHVIGFRAAMATVGAGSLAGAIFFQLAGQLIARGVLARRAGMPFAAVVVVTAYERIVAAIVSGLLGLAGAWFIFGRIYLDQNSGGAQLMKITLGLIAAATGGALIGYGPMAARSIAPFLTYHFVRRCLGIIGLTLLVQIPTMIAYVAAAHSLFGRAPITDLIAASAVVMFVASVPISLAGWGVREMSAVVALGAIGMSGSDALTAAILIGTGSMLAMAAIAAVSMPGFVRGRPVAEAEVESSVDYHWALGWFLPLTAAVFVLFQIYVPVGSGLLNVNLADPVALLAAALFILKFFRQGHLPRWRVGYINIAVAAATLALGTGLLIGVARFGWTDWAWINRFLGWFVLLAFGATGALVVAEGGKEAFRIMLLTYIGAVAAVTLSEVLLIFAAGLGLHVPPQLVNPHAAEAFAQNRNFFAFQLLMALAAALVLLRGPTLRICVLALFFAGIWFAGSRSGWIAAAAVLAASMYFGAAAPRECTKVLGCAVVVALIGAVLPAFHFLDWLVGLVGLGGIHDWIAGAPIVPDIVPSGVSTQERLLTWTGGLKLFVAHPIFGAGLGAFRNQMILATSGIPLVIHSTALWLLAELGVVGFLAFAIPAVYVTTTEWVRAPRIQASAVSALCIVAFAVMSGTADMVYQRTFWLLIGAALAKAVQR